MKINILKRKLTLFVILTSVIVIPIALHFQEKKQENEKRAKLQIEESVKRFRESGMKASKLQQANGFHVEIQQGDEIFSQNTTSNDDTAQAKLWQSMPKHKRDAMRNNFTNPENHP